ncbi:hypothetical protein PPGU19_070210 (plasmid) [Paraburkholderia sp. PGU19]|uniref:DUF3601 domain-containing protein n=1 Tax=Paraburkholderia sp. PGU19 TaxID=2735434 RepID=UPI0015DAC87A|nr:DUF3601 domain-containing protein [Paraburkholderia sp. PGU19]BCG02453.1 hypothetical protein PPGU19_070210 [Paraburkholderia sp. PGU19]
MLGPKSRGHWSTHLQAPNCGYKYKCLTAGDRHTVVQPFTDFDGDVHSPGETWTFLGYAFAPHDDGLSLFVSLNLADEWHIRLGVDEPPNVASQIENFVKTASS